MKEIKVRVEAIIFNSQNELLLANHQKNNNSYWVLPGGGVDFGESIEEALKRELSEELNLSHVEIQQLMYADEYISEDLSRHIIKLAYKVEVPEEDLDTIKVVAKEEAIKEIQFFSTQKLNQSVETFYPDKALYKEILDIG